MKRLTLILTLSLCMNFIFINNAKAGNYQYVITSDGVTHAIPEEFTPEMVAWFIDIYEDILEMERNVNKKNEPKYV